MQTWPFMWSYQASELISQEQKTEDKACDWWILYLTAIIMLLTDANQTKLLKEETFL